MKEYFIDNVGDQGQIKNKQLICCFFFSPQWGTKTTCSSQSYIWTKSNGEIESAVDSSLWDQSWDNCRNKLDSAYYCRMMEKIDLYPLLFSIGTVSVICDLIFRFLHFLFF